MTEKYREAFNAFCHAWLVLVEFSYFTSMNPIQNSENIKSALCDLVVHRRLRHFDNGDFVNKFYFLSATHKNYKKLKRKHGFII